MIIFGPMLVLLGIGFFCWLLFNLAVFALPFFAGLTIGIWALHSGAGALGAIAVGLIAGGATFAIGQFALAVIPWTWARLLIILVYVAPATVAGYSATHGLARWRCLRPSGRRSSPLPAPSPSASRRLFGTQRCPRPELPDRAWRGANNAASTVGAAPDQAPRASAILIVDVGARTA